MFASCSLLLLLLPLALVLPQSHALHLPPLLPLFPNPATRLQASQDSQGFTGEPCSHTNASVCTFPRHCLRLTAIFEPCTANDSLCVCSAPVLLPCSSTQACWPGDRCLRIPPVPQPLCLSCNLLRSNPALLPVDFQPTSLCPLVSHPSVTPPIPGPSPDADPDPETSLDPSVSVPPQFDPGYTGDECIVDAPDTCVSPRKCRNLDFLPCTPSDSLCICAESSARPCDTSSDCLVGDVCVTEADPSIAICISCNLYFDLWDILVRVDDLPVCHPITITPTFAPPSQTPSQFPSPSSTGVGTGATGEFCHESNPDFCLSSRECIDVQTATPCSSSSLDCICVDIDALLCTTSQDCLVGDRCVSDTDLRICYSCHLAQMPGSFDLVDDGHGNCLFTSPSAPPSPTPKQRGGATGDACEFNVLDTCETPRECVNQGGTLCTPSDPICLCFEETLRFCDASADCLVGDRCARLDGLPDSMCLSCTLVEDFVDTQPVDDDMGSCNGSFTETPLSSPSSQPSSIPIPPSPFPPFNPNVQGGTGEACRASDNVEFCGAPRKCRNVMDGSLCEEDSEEGCWCFEEVIRYCGSSVDCPNGDRCVRIDGSASVCYSCLLERTSVYVDPVDDGKGRCDGDPFSLATPAVTAPF